MHRRRLLIVVALGVSVCATTTVSGASSAPTASRPYRILHVCDGPPSMASEERAAILLALAKRGLIQGRNLDLATFDVEKSRAGRLDALSAVGREGIDNSYATFFKREIPRMRAQLFAHEKSGGEGLNPRVLLAIKRLQDAG